MEHILQASGTGYAKLDKWFNILKVVLFCMPFVYLAYLGIGTGGAMLNENGVLQGNPTMAVTFLTAMIQPYVGWLLILSHRRLADGRTSYAVLNLALLLLAELMCMSTVGVVGLGLILWKTGRTYGISPFQAWRQAEKKNLFFEIGGSILVCLLGGLCLFCTIRLGGMPW